MMLIVNRAPAYLLHLSLPCLPSMVRVRGIHPHCRICLHRFLKKKEKLSYCSWVGPKKRISISQNVSVFGDICIEKETAVAEYLL